jgi:hypothetical protein
VVGKGGKIPDGSDTIETFGEDFVRVEHFVKKVDIIVESETSED